MAKVKRPIAKRASLLNLILTFALLLVRLWLGRGEGDGVDERA